MGWDRITWTWLPFIFWLFIWHFSFHMGIDIFSTLWWWWAVVCMLGQVYVWHVCSVYVWCVCCDGVNRHFFLKQCWACGMVAGCVYVVVWWWWDHGLTFPHDIFQTSQQCGWDKRPIPPILLLFPWFYAFSATTYLLPTTYSFCMLLVVPVPTSPTPLYTFYNMTFSNSVYNI